MVYLRHQQFLILQVLTVLHAALHPAITKSDDGSLQAASISSAFEREDEAISSSQQLLPVVPEAGSLDEEDTPSHQLLVPQRKLRQAILEASPQEIQFLLSQGTDFQFDLDIQQPD